MLLFQFCYSQGKSLSITQLVNSNDLGVSKCVVENKEGIYVHGKVNGKTKKDAENNLNYYMDNVYPLEVKSMLVSRM